MKIPIRYFSLGLLTSAIVFYIMYMIIDDSEPTVEDQSIEQLTEAIEKQGYRIISQDEFISYSLYLDEMKEQEKDGDSNNKDTSKKEADQKKSSKKDQESEENEAVEEEEEEEEVKKLKIKVESGFVSQNIADLLEEEGFIENANEFVTYLEENDYSPYIQIGEFEVASDMTMKDIAETITTYPGN